MTGRGRHRRHRGHPIFAALYDSMMGRAERRFFGRHRAHLAGTVTGRVLDLGSGTGVNLSYYPPAAAVVGIEPDPYMLRRAHARALHLGARAALLQSDAEALPFAAGTFDVALVTLVLCTVADPAGALAELRRVLRPGGEIRFFEHVRAASRGWARFQDAATPAWSLVGAGCHPNRDTVRTIEAAGFRIVELRRYAFGPYPVRPMVRGVAIRS
jgi:SAM-dependent methyltransferase